ncbi:hypothetical protein RCO28_12505 [Streptomyces sp. LHD-70]|uniref:hypothetical protein n=1 Tax=Streptomyces sp. LHD-70 TaxID=3072140 RepID=UPI00280C414B|nr:hypothetical protein [Streptomyces sp. LHD-70]MDQ8703303.1 hypothetical protein [Streptomyces sp. LHD-70]
MPAAVGTVWSSKEESAEQILDLVDINGTPITQLVADERGVIPLFWGPPGAEYLWIDFGVGRMKLTSNTIGERFKAHTEALDPHNSKQYTDEQLNNYLAKRGNTLTLENGSRWLDMEGSDAPNGDTILQRNGAAGYNFALRRDGSVTHVAHTDKNVPVEVRGGLKPHKYALIINDGTSGNGGTSSQFKVDFQGNVETKGTVQAGNIGTARVFSGPTAPANPRVGDVWVAYGA